MTLVEFALMAAAALLAFVPSPATIVAGAAILVVVYLWQRRRQLGAAGLPAAEPAKEV